MFALAASRSDRGATAVEYALLIALIAGVIITAVLLFGDSVFGLFEISNDSRW
ncbi:Flp family type IVb pilin [Nocardioides sp. CPCC 206347]|uniref:Flp family type IVb pilin n=1 Tax=unclassified Nocardioides TaxID=2615069 RepID=UPI0036207E3B